MCFLLLTYCPLALSPPGKSSRCLPNLSGKLGFTVLSAPKNYSLAMLEVHGKLYQILEMLIKAGPLYIAMEKF